MAPLSTYTSTRTKAWWSSKGLDGGFGHHLSGVGAVVDGLGLGEDVESEVAATFGPVAVLLGSLQAQPIRLPARKDSGSTFRLGVPTGLDGQGRPSLLTLEERGPVRPARSDAAQAVDGRSITNARIAAPDIHR